MTVLRTIGLLIACLLSAGAPLSAFADAPEVPEGRLELGPGGVETVPLASLRAGRTYRVGLTLLKGDLGPADRVHAELRGVDGERLSRYLHAGDPDLYLPYRPDRDGDASLVVRSDPGSGPLVLEYRRAEIPLGPDESAAIEAEPNDDPRHANRLVLGRDVYGSADDVDYLDNQDEGTKGLDWFRFDVDDEKPFLVYFQLDLLDRDVSANLRVYTVDADGKPKPYESGKDPMEIVHDRERERYSKHISRTFTKGTYYLQVNANHPAYILRTRKLPVPPYDDPALAVEAGMHYIMNVGDAWFAQVPREGNIFVRAANIHDTGTRCTACHPSVFSTESNLVAHRNGYPIRSKDNFRYVVDRLYNSITPLYGVEGLYWQRFIAIPLQAQGKQGGILLDYEAEVSGRETPTFARFGPFLKAAWERRDDLPPDEQNGVVPLDSKFGFAWRDWRVLTEMARRTGREDYKWAAENLARIVNAGEADDRVETLQDLMHQFYAWRLTDPKRNSGRVSDWAGALLALQNEDGGWNETFDVGNHEARGPSAVYATGQMVWTLRQANVQPSQPEIKKAVRYLLSQQQPFGGWFQTTTHENFRTPMRETRYAVEALAAVFPRPGPPLKSWGNRDEGPARLPDPSGSIVQKLDDLENLWDVPEAERSKYAQEINKYLDDPEPLVRASAAACLGRLGRFEAVEPLIRRLDDPSKIVWRASAWALRTLGNLGVGGEQILRALESPDPRTRRGAARIFAYQFYGMDERPEIALRLIELTDDPDLWTRLQALKTLRQWFYRTNDNVLKRRIVRAYLARMGKPEVPVIRKNLREGMYIMLDENLGGGVSLQKNVSELPEVLRPGIFKGREEVERGVLLLPLLSALESGNALQREAIVGSFDGSFFKGRSFARRPEGMLDVGNDREFGFFYEPPTDVLDRAFASLFSGDDLSPEVKRQALQLASFFRVPERSARPAIQSALLRLLADPDPEVREAARLAVGDGLALKGAESDADRIAAIRKNLLADSATCRATVLALARNPALVTQPLIRDDLRALLSRDNAALILQPVLTASIFRDDEVLTAIRRAWNRAEDPKDRLALLETLFGRATILNVDEPPEPALALMRDAVHDESASVRERALRAVAALKTPWAGRVSDGLLLSSLADDSPSLRVLGLTLAAPRAAFWARPDAREHLLRLIVDPDARVRDQALQRVEEHRLMVDRPALARRVKALLGDPALKGRAASALGSQGYQPEAIKADVALARPRLLSLATFREKVNPIFYRAGADGHACAECHANHTILRIAEADPAAGLTGEQLMTNYNSVLKVINLGDPESSLILRKPRSPRGQGGADPESPTGLTHVGGPRWESTDDPAYGALLAWIREASGAASSASSPLHLTADSYAPGYEPALASDGDPSTIWHTEFVGARPGYPHDLTVDLGAPKRVNGLLYVPRQESPNGRVRDFEVHLSEDGKTWGKPVARGTWDNDPTYKFVDLSGKAARFVRLRGLSEVEGRPVMSAAELVIEHR